MKSEKLKNKSELRLRSATGNEKAIRNCKWGELTGIQDFPIFV